MLNGLHSIGLAASVALLAAFGFRTVPPPSVDDLEHALELRLKRLIPPRFSVRTVLFEQVVAAAPQNGAYPFVVTANIHDYGPGTPAKKLYGQTCLRRMENWTFALRADSAGGWSVEGRMTGADSVCMDNPAEGESSIPLETLMSSSPATLDEDAGNVSTGEWRCVDARGQPIDSLTFVLRANGRYADVKGSRGGTYVYSGTRSELVFRGGFLGGRIGTDVQISGFVLSPTVTCEPKR